MVFLSFLLEREIDVRFVEDQGGLCVIFGCVEFVLENLPWKVCFRELKKQVGKF